MTPFVTGSRGRSQQVVCTASWRAVPQGSVLGLVRLMVMYTELKSRHCSVWPQVSPVPVRGRLPVLRLLASQTVNGVIEQISRINKPLLGTWDRGLGSKAVRASAIQLQYNCNTMIFFLYCSCIALVRTA